MAVSGLTAFGAVSVVIPSAASAAPHRAAKHARAVARAARTHEAATPATAPQAPFIEEAIPEGLSVLVNWDPNPATDDVTGYKLTTAVASGFKASKKCAKAQKISAQATDSAALVPKLCAGVPYVITMTATNTAGTSAASAPSNPAVPLVAQAPSSPLITSVESLSDSLIVDWSAPSITGGDPVTSYLLTTTAGTKTTKTKTSVTEATVAQLTNGTAYTLSLVAVSKAGTSAPSTSTGMPAATTAPGAPASLQVVPDGQGDLVATWSAPVDPGSNAVSGYSVTTQPETETNGVWSATGSPTTETLGATATTTTLNKSTLSATGFYTVSVAATSPAPPPPPPTR
jgi:hypothetical protein